MLTIEYMRRGAHCSVYTAYVMNGLSYKCVSLHRHTHIAAIYSNRCNRVDVVYRLIINFPFSRGAWMNRRFFSVFSALQILANHKQFPIVSCMCMLDVPKCVCVCVFPVRIQLMWSWVEHTKRIEDEPIAEAAALEVASEKGGKYTTRFLLFPFTMRAEAFISDWLVWVCRWETCISQLHQRHGKFSTVCPPPSIHLALILFAYSPYICCFNRSVSVSVAVYYIQLFDLFNVCLTLLLFCCFCLMLHTHTHTHTSQHLLRRWGYAFFCRKNIFISLGFGFREPGIEERCRNIV